jgi:hypothetical protein
VKLIYILTGNLFLDIVPKQQFVLGNWISRDSPLNELSLSLDISLLWIESFLAYQEVRILLQKYRLVH